MKDDLGASQATGLAGAEAPEPHSRLGPTDGIPSAAPWWRCVQCGWEEYVEHVFTGHMRGVPMVHCAKCEALHSVPDPNSPRALRWNATRLATALSNLLELQDFHSDRAHWESEHKAGNGAAWRVLGAMDALDAIAMETQRAETVKQGSVAKP